MDTFLVHKLTGLEESKAKELAPGIRVITQAEADAVAAEMEKRVLQIVDSCSRI